MSSVDHLAAELKRRYEGAGDRDKVVQMHLFAIKHAEALKSVRLPVLLERAGMGTSYGTELRKGIRLAEHVSLKA